jgi:hypothetical protein
MVKFLDEKFVLRLSVNDLLTQARHLVPQTRNLELQFLLMRLLLQKGFLVLLELGLGLLEIVPHVLKLVLYLAMLLVLVLVAGLQLFQLFEAIKQSLVGGLDTLELVEFLLQRFLLFAKLVDLGVFELLHMPYRCLQ